MANKIATYMVAVLAKRHNIPFYVACPLSTIDLNVPNGKAIPIEERSEEEVKVFRGYHWAAEGGKKSDQPPPIAKKYLNCFKIRKAFLCVKLHMYPDLLRNKA